MRSESRSSGAREVVGFTQDDTGVDVELSDDSTLQAQYLIGCDGGRSLVRKTAGIDFPGWDPTTSFLIAEVEMEEEPEIGMRPEGGGIGPVNREEGGNPYGVVLLEKQIEHTSEPTMEYLSEALVAAYGTDYGVHSPTWISRFTDMTRQAASYRQGRVLLAGDAAHVHGPQGGQGLNTGVQDAVNLGWKLAQVVNQTSPESLLDTYHAERHPVGARVLQNTMAQVALARTDERSQALRHTVLELLSMDEPRRRIAGMISGLDIHYDLGEGHPLLGRRMPDLDLVTAGGPLRLFTLLHDARPVLVNLGEPGGFDITPWAARVRMVDADVRRDMGASGDWRGPFSPGRVDPTRWLCCLGGRPHPPGAARCAHLLVRTTGCDVGPAYVGTSTEFVTWLSGWALYVSCRTRARPGAKPTQPQVHKVKKEYPVKTRWSSSRESICAFISALFSLGDPPWTFSVGVEGLEPPASSL